MYILSITSVSFCLNYRGRKFYNLTRFRFLFLLKSHSSIFNSMNDVGYLLL